MGTKLCLLLVLLHCAMTESTTIYPHCLNAPVDPNRMRCFSWSYNETSKECNLVPGPIINLFPGTDLIFPPGHFQGGYLNNYFCKWRISPVTPCHRTGFQLLSKDLHVSVSRRGNIANCAAMDHVQLAYFRKEQQSEFYCGGDSVNNCPVFNCPQGFKDSSGDTYVIFRSDATGTSSGFLALIKNDIEIQGCRRYVIPFQKIIVPRTIKCSTHRFRKLPCECSGTCTVGAEVMKSNPNHITRVINGILANPRDALRRAYRYVNSDNIILRGFSRRVVKNIKLFHVPVPTTSQRLDYASAKLERCTKLEMAIRSNPRTYPAAYEYLQRLTKQTVE